MIPSAHAGYYYTKNRRTSGTCCKDIWVGTLLHEYAQASHAVLLDMIQGRNRHDDVMTDDGKHDHDHDHDEQTLRCAPITH